MRASQTLTHIEPHNPTQEYLKKIATISIDMEGAVEAILKMYLSTLDNKESRSWASFSYGPYVRRTLYT